MYKVNVKPCGTCGKMRQIRTGGNCNACYWDAREEARPGIKGERASKERKRRQAGGGTNESIRSFSNREAVKIIAEAFARHGVRPEDLISYIHESRRRNPCSQQAS